MKNLCTWILYLSFLIPAFGQWEYTKGPENFSISTMVNKKDSIFCLNHGKIYASKEDPISWGLFMGGIPANTEFTSLIESGDYLVAASNSAVYLLPKGSGNWKKSEAGLPDEKFLSTFYVFDNEHIFIEFFIESKNNYCVFKLDHAQNTWVEIPELQNSYAFTMAHDPQKGFYAAYDYEDFDFNYDIFHAVSNPDGTQWTQSTITDIDSLDFYSIVYHDSLLIASNYYDEILQSKDFGKSWRKLPLDLEFFGYNKLLSKDKSLYIVTTGYIYLSEDRGQSFVPIVEDFFISSTSPVQVADNSVYYSSEGIPGLALLEDGFWFQTDLYFPAHFISRNYLVTDQKVICYGFGGCYDLTSLDSLDLLATKNLPKAGIFTSSVKSGDDLFAYANQGIYRYDLTTKEWALAMDGIDFPFMPVNPGFATKGDSTIMANYFGVYLWDNENKLWNSLDDAPFVFDEANLKANSKYYYGLIDGEFFLWRGGNNEWQSIDLPASLYDPLDLAFKGDTLFYVDRDGFSYSTDLGFSWSKGPAVGITFSTARFVNTGNRLFAILQNGRAILEISTKNITTQIVSIPSALGETLNMGLVFNTNDLFFARVYDDNFDYYLYVSADFGKTWKKVNQAPEVTISNDALAIGDQLYFATESGVWKLPASDLGLLTATLNPRNIQKAEFFPNPSTGKFSLQTNIQELLTEPVMVNVFNTYGQKVKSYATQLHGSTLEVDLSNAANGVYHVFLQSGQKAWKSQIVKID